MTYLSGIHDLAYVFTRVGASADAGARQDWVSLGANIGAGIGKFIWYQKGQALLKDTLAKVGTKALPTPTAIIDVTMVVVAIVDLLNGFGAPENGSKFGNGVDKLKVVDSKLELAIPDARDWSGPAATAYAEQLTALRALVAQMQELDKQMQTTVGAQGEEIFQAHRTLAILGFALVAAQGAALLMYLIPIVGPEVSLLFQVVAALAAATTVTVQESLVLGRSFNNASDAERLTGEYMALGAKAESDPAFATIKVAQAEQTTVGSFTDISDSISAFSAAPSVSSLAGRAGVDGRVFEERRVMASAVVGGGPAITSTTDGASGSVVLTTDAGTTPGGGPVVAPPTLGQVTGQMAKVAKDLAQPLNVTNQVMGQVQQIVSMAQQGQGVEEPPADEAALAASGAEIGERAPVDAATAEGEPTEVRGPAQRPGVM